MTFTAVFPHSVALSLGEVVAFGSTKTIKSRPAIRRTGRPVRAERTNWIEFGSWGCQNNQVAIRAAFDFPTLEATQVASSAALSGSNLKAPGFAGGYLLFAVGI